LECWNDGILEKWVWDTAMLGQWPTGGGTKNLKWIISFKNTIIPSFHYSIIP
jgi:hypothetical protein